VSVQFCGKKEKERTKRRFLIRKKRVRDGCELISKEKDGIMITKLKMEERNWKIISV